MADRPGLRDRRRRSAHEKGLWELRESLTSRISELEALLRAKTGRGELPVEAQALADQAFKELEEARSTLRHDHRRRIPAAHLAVAQTRFDVAHNLMLRIASLDEVTAMMPGLVAYIREHLPVSDERRVQVEEIALAIRSGSALHEVQREVVVDAVAVARHSHLRENLRVRSFTYVVYGMSVALSVIVVVLGVLGAMAPETVPLCFRPEKIGVVCPTESDMSEGSRDPDGDIDDLYATVASSWDYPVVLFIGIVAAAVAAATSLRRIKGTSTPYNVPVALALLKLPTGALTAVLGLLLMRGEFVPGLQALDSSAQIVAWAVIFGYSQQLFTKLVDNQAQSVLNSVGGPHSTPGKPTRDPQTPAA
ncbi:hypothetical protein E2C00_01675 [Streptomyces sp. WAC05374]|uniref:hypothetical protein n=1 Tax=Streptomyces sp. WAC05374 TaxID=2487420 RepID=UPI000F8649B6|nr:hypothetical protein [Streptomyces sp. WAC05374]RST06427.1 hypothetical protein EF905_32225 [Streptomyces sp. WAC05374]TDF50246.1 hypothetical protein E2B92_01650 [Streptomyces sp. WAC05374]TDF57970.1 hypothetical protein E2C02_09440 [Streptomyces sp. WAC05374]TDF60499.1 hypothetical protein E2C00_01675 [Streptomyces sp. WAC05374]